MKMGLKLDIQDIEKKELKETILELVENKKYTEKSQLMSRNFRDQPQQPMERALWWIDYVLRNPNVSFLKNKKLKKMNYFVKHSVDVIAFLTFVAVVVTLLFIKVVIFLIKRKISKSKKLKDQ